MRKMNSYLKDYSISKTHSHPLPLLNFRTFYCSVKLDIIEFSSETPGPRYSPDLLRTEIEDSSNGYSTLVNISKHYTASLQFDRSPLSRRALEHRVF